MQNEFGQPMRSPVDDANEGILYPKQDTQVTPGGQNLDKQEVGDVQLDDAVNSFGNAFGNALDRVAQNVHKMSQEERAQNAVVRQALNTTINDVDQTAKRTGWTKAFAGESAQYRAAQMAAVTNRVAEAELADQSDMWKNAHLTPDMYLKKRQAGMAKFLEPYKDDPEARREFATAYIASSARLAQTQYKEHYAYTQQVMYNENVRSLELAIDNTLLMNNANQDPKKIEESWNGIYAAYNRNDGRIPSEAQHKALMEVTNKQLRNGNIVFYQEMLKRGLYDNLSDKDQETIQKSIEQYDTQLDYKFRTVVDNLRFRSEAPIGVRDQWIEYEESLARLQGMHKYLSGSPRSWKNFEKAQADLFKMKPEKIKAAAKQRVRTNVIRAYIKDNFASQTVEDITEYPTGKDDEKRPATAEERQLAADFESKREIGAVLGIQDENEVDNIPSDKLVHTLLTDPAVAGNITRRLAHTNLVPKLLKDLSTNFMSGYEQSANVVDGKPDEDLIAGMNVLKQIKAVDYEYFSKMMGESAAKFEIIQAGLDAGRTPYAIKQQFENGELLKKTDGVKSIPKLKGEDGHSSSVEYLRQTFSKELGTNPTAGDLQKVASWYTDGLAYNNNDDKAAKAYVKNMLTSYTTRVFNKTIPNGKWLESWAGEESNVTIEEVLDHISQKDVQIGHAVISRLQNQSKEELRQYNLRKIPGLTITPDPRRDGFWLDAANSAKGKVFIDKSTYARWARDAENKKKLARIREEKVEEVLLEQQQNDMLLQGGYVPVNTEAAKRIINRSE